MFKTTKFRNGLQWKTVVDGKTNIQEPCIGDIVYLKTIDKSAKHNIGDVIKVRIVRGKYLSNERVSNYWTWIRLGENDEDLFEESGYGNFFSLS